MSKKNQPPRLIQKLTGWSYTRSLQFVRDNQEAADSFAIEEGITPKDALLKMAEAEVETKHGLDCLCKGCAQERFRGGVDDG